MEFIYSLVLSNTIEQINLQITLTSIHKIKLQIKAQPLYNMASNQL